MQALAFSGGKDSMVCLFLMRDSLDFAIYVDTGYAYPETLEMVEFAKTMIPVHVVKSDRKGQNDCEGIPADVVPITWTRYGQQSSGAKPALIQSYLGCCYENIALPLFKKAQELGVTEIVYGQRNQETHKAPVRDGNVFEGITRRQPIEGWTEDDVFAYLKTKMDIPAHFSIKHSSLDCYDCPAYDKESKDRVAWTKEKYPAFYAEYAIRSNTVISSILSEISNAN